MTFSIKKTQRSWDVITTTKRQVAGKWVTSSRSYCECRCRDFAEHIAEALNKLDGGKK